MQCRARGRTLLLMQPWVDADICFENFPYAGDLVNHFHLTLEQAAKTRDMSVTGLKALCRERGVKRWPFRLFSSMRRKCQTSGVTAPVVESVDECTSCAIVPVDERVTGAPTDCWLMLPADEYTSCIDRLIVDWLADLPPRSSHDPPPPSPPDREPDSACSADSPPRSSPDPSPPSRADRKPA